MIIPNQIKIGGHKIKISFSTSAEINNAGEFLGYYQRIRLRKEQDTPQDAVDEAFLHEIIEGMKYFNNLDIDHKDLTIISEGLFQIMKENKLTWIEDE